MAEFSVVFLTKPQVGYPVQIAFNGSRGQTDPVVSVQQHPTQPHLLKVATRNGSVCVGPLDPNATASSSASSPHQQPPMQSGPQPNVPYQAPFPYYSSKPRKEKLTAGLLGILLGDLGVHKFYMGEIGLGIVYLIFSCTGIPGIIGLIEGIIYLTMSDYDWDMKYNH